jgi:hypothetical protein
MVWIQWLWKQQNGPRRSAPSGRVSGGASGIRTPDLRIMIPSL